MYLGLSAIAGDGARRPRQGQGGGGGGGGGRTREFPRTPEIRVRGRGRYSSPHQMEGVRRGVVSGSGSVNQAPPPPTPASLGAVCRKIPGLVNQQIEVCQKSPQKIFSISIGARTGILECHWQFRFERWNCTTSLGYESVFGRMLEKGTKETAFVYAITSAGVVHAITKACSRGNLTDCSCDLSHVDKPTGEDWKWGGCSDNVNFGLDFAKTFVDAPEAMKHASMRNVRNLMNLHNNEAGRKVIQENMKLKCRCHGVSGSCAVKTCWKTMASFREIGDLLKDKYAESVRVAPRSRKRLRRKEKRRRKVPIAFEDLVHIDNSPSYCNRDEHKGILGTRGRVCNKTSNGAEGCQLLCCGRGYNTQVVEKMERCECRFIWCCEVKCKTCITRFDLHTCK